MSPVTPALGSSGRNNDEVVSATTEKGVMATGWLRGRGLKKLPKRA